MTPKTRSSIQRTYTVSIDKTNTVYTLKQRSYRSLRVNRVHVQFEDFEVPGFHSNILYEHTNKVNSISEVEKVMLNLCFKISSFNRGIKNKICRRQEMEVVQISSKILQYLVTQYVSKFAQVFDVFVLY